MNRRAFLLRCGAASLGASLALSAWPAPVLGAMAVATDRPRVERTRLGMGTYVTVTAVHASRGAAGEAVEAAFAEMARLEAELSRFDSSSALYALNRDGRISGGPESLALAVSGGLDLHRMTQGAFDPTVAPVVDLMRSRSNPAGEMDLSQAEIREAVSRIGAGKIRLKGRDISFGAPGMALTLDGAAKGAIVDSMSRVMSEAGVTDHLVNAGGDIRASGRPAADRFWRVGLEDPIKGGVLRTINLTDGGLAASGGYVNFYDRRKLHHHIVVPGSGASPNGLAEAAVFAPTVQEADGLATACMVLGLRRAAALMDALPGRSAWFVTPSGAQAATRGFPA